MQGGINSGRITLSIHIPGQTEFISLTIKSIIELENFSKGYKSCLYRLASTFRNPPLVSSYFVSDTDLFSKIINNRFFNNSRPHLLCKAKIEDTTIFDFISLVQKSFKDMITATFNDKFILDNYNQTTTLAIFQPNFLDTLNKDYNRSFDVFKKLTDPTQIVILL